MSHEGIVLYFKFFIIVTFLVYCERILSPLVYGGPVYADNIDWSFISESLESDSHMYNFLLYFNIC